MTTLETGAGPSTVVFALSGARHVAVTPNTPEAERIRAWCPALGVEAAVTSVHESSDTALPRPGVVPPALDFVLIDGAHRFPFACMHWHHTQRQLRIGGIVGVDDWRTPSVRVHHDFLCGEDEWSRIAKAGRTAFFRKVTEPQIVNDCHGQRINRPFLRGEGG